MLDKLITSMHLSERFWCCLVFVTLDLKTLKKKINLSPTSYSENHFILTLLSSTVMIDWVNKQWKIVCWKRGFSILKWKFLLCTWAGVGSWEYLGEGSGDWGSKQDRKSSGNIGNFQDSQSWATAVERGLPSTSWAAGKSCRELQGCSFCESSSMMRQFFSHHTPRREWVSPVENRQEVTLLSL